MKHLKIFESYKDRRTLVQQLDDEFIQKYFRENYGSDIDTISQMVDIWKYVDDDRYVRDFINDYVSSSDINDFDKYDYIRYIENELDTEDVKKYLKKKAKKKKVDVDDVLKELSKNQLIKIIESEDAEEDFLRDLYESIYGNRDAFDILVDFYGEADLRENGYKYVKDYVDDQELIDAFFDTEDFSYKMEYTGEQIEWDKSLQKKLLKIDPDNSLTLFDIMDATNSIGATYNYQNKYMKSIMKKEKADGLYIAKKLKKLNDKFGLAPAIKTKYKDYTFYIDTEKYNL